MPSVLDYWWLFIGNIEGPASLANTVPLSETVCNAGPLADGDHMHPLNTCTCSIKPHTLFGWQWTMAKVTKGSP